jgi:hypothetical protein
VIESDGRHSRGGEHAAVRGERSPTARTEAGNGPAMYQDDSGTCAGNSRRSVQVEVKRSAVGRLVHQPFAHSNFRHAGDAIHDTQLGDFLKGRLRFGRHSLTSGRLLGCSRRHRSKCGREKNRGASSRDHAVPASMHWETHYRPFRCATQAPTRSCPGLNTLRGATASHPSNGSRMRSTQTRPSNAQPIRVHPSASL